MSGKNDEVNGMAVIFAVLGAGVIILGMVVFAIMVLLAAALTLVAFVAWFKPLTLFGETVQPQEARWFVYRGIIGMIGVPAFVVFCAAFYDLHIDDALWSWLYLGGYVAGSVGIEALMAMNEAENAAAKPISPSPLPPMPTVQIEARPGQKTDHFKFASWQDEEKRG